VSAFSSVDKVIENWRRIRPGELGQICLNHFVYSHCKLHSQHSVITINVPRLDSPSIASLMIVISFKILFTVFRCITYILLYVFITARCYAERGYEIACRLSVRLSVTLKYDFHTGWNTSKINLRPNSLRPLLWLTPNMGDLVQREHPQNWG